MKFLLLVIALAFIGIIVGPTWLGAIAFFVLWCAMYLLIFFGGWALLLRFSARQWMTGKDQYYETR